MNSRTFFFALSLLAVIAAASAFKRGGMVGGYSPIKDINSPEVQEMAKYAVMEHNKRAATKLEYVEVMKAEQKVVAGTNYRLVISAKLGDSKYDGVYETVINDRPWDHHREVTSFTSA